MRLIWRDDCLSLLALNESKRLLTVGLFPSGETKAQEAFQAIAKQADLGGQSSAPSVGKSRRSF